MEIFLLIEYSSDPNYTISHFDLFIGVWTKMWIT